MGADQPDEHLRIERTAPLRRIELSPGSWVDVVDGLVRHPAQEMQQVLDEVPWRQSEVLRYDRYVPERRLGASLAFESSPLLRHIDLHLRSLYRVRWSGVAALLYRDGHDFQGLHSDRELRWLDETLIAITVLGDRRPFVLRPRSPSRAQSQRIPAGEGPDDVVLRPGEGDLLVMGGRCQQEWLHGVPAVARSGPRVSLTWRWTSRRGQPDTWPTYRDGRQFSDGPRWPGIRSRPT